MGLCESCLNLGETDPPTGWLKSSVRPSDCDRCENY